MLRRNRDRLGGGRGFRVVGYDLDEDALGRARRRHPDLTFCTGSAKEALQVADRDLTVCLEVIEHLPGKAQASFLKAIADGTRQGGRLVLSTPGRHSVLSLYERARGSRRRESSYDWWDPTHVGVTSWRRLSRLLREAGFEPLELVGFGYLPRGVVAPFPISWPPVARCGFDLMTVALRL